MDARDQPVIVIDASMLMQSLPYAHFLMAHECCHHTLGHVRLTSESLGQLGPQPFYYIRPLLKTMELDADTCAVKMLKQTKEPDAIEVAREAMLQFGNMPTGAYYPTGVRARGEHRPRRGRKLRRRLAHFFLFFFFFFVSRAISKRMSLPSPQSF